MGPATPEAKRCEGRRRSNPKVIEEALAVRSADHTSATGSDLAGIDAGVPHAVHGFYRFFYCATRYRGSRNGTATIG